MRLEDHKVMLGIFPISISHVHTDNFCSCSWMQKKEGEMRT